MMTSLPMLVNSTKRWENTSRMRGKQNSVLWRLIFFVESRNINLIWNLSCEKLVIQCLLLLPTTPACQDGIGCCSLHKAVILRASLCGLISKRHYMNWFSSTSGVIYFSVSASASNQCLVQRCGLNSDWYAIRESRDVFNVVLWMKSLEMFILSR